MARRIEVIRTPYSVVAPVNEIAAPEWTNMTSFRSGFRHINLRTMGLSLDGTTDETAAFQSVLDGASNGDVIVLDERANLRIGGQINVNGKTIRIEGKGDARITSTQKLGVPLLNVVNAPGSRIAGLTIDGPETAFDGVYNTQAYTLELRDCPDAVVRNIRITNMSRGVGLYTSDRAQVDGLVFLGNEPAYVENINFMSALTVRAHDVKISRVHAESCGSAILIGWESQRGQIMQVSGYNTFDNGVYVSSGHGWEIHAATFRADPAYTGNIGTGVKMRGNNNVLMGGLFEHMGTGAVITGSGIDNGDGYDGYGSRIVGARAIRSHVLGFAIEPAQTLNCRDAAIIGCHVEGSGWNGGANAAAIRVIGGRGHRVSNNTIFNHLNGSYALLVLGTAEDYARDVKVESNKVRAPANTAIYGAYIDRCRFVGNEMENVLTAPYGLRLALATNNEVSHTYAVGTVGTTAHIQVNEAASTNNRIINNANCTIVDNGGGTIKYGNGNGNPVVTGSWGGNVAGKNLAQQLHQNRQITDQTTL